jgi:probable F420-dependent oxidoreductase
MASPDQLGRAGIWSPARSVAFRGDRRLTGAVIDGAAALGKLGYQTLRTGQSASVRYAEPLLEATRRVRIATGIVSTWEHDPVPVVRQRADLEQRHPSRFVLGLGISHGDFSPLIGLPLHGHEPVPVRTRQRVRAGAAQRPAADGARPEILAPARSRAAGAHPYLVTVRHAAEARQILGPDAVLALEMTVVVNKHPARARQSARNFLAGYLTMRNHTASQARDGFTQDDFRAGGSGRLVDGLVAARTGREHRREDHGVAPSRPGSRGGAGSDPGAPWTAAARTAPARRCPAPEPMPAM